MFDLSGKVALVTGGSRGLGLQIAGALGEQGARLVLSSGKATDLEQARVNLSKLGYEADTVAADNSKDADISRLVDDTFDKAGRIRHSNQQCRRELGNSIGGPSCPCLGQGDEPQHSFAVPVEPAGRQAFDDPPQIRPHHQHGVDRGTAWSCRRAADDRVQHEQGRGG